MTENLYCDISKRIKSNIRINKSDYEDLIHDTIVRLFEKGIHEETDCKKICVIVALNILRDQKRKRKNTIIYIPDYKPNCIDESIELELKEPIKNREFYIMRYKLGMSFDEISVFLKCKPSTVRGMHARLKKEFIKENNLKHF